MGFGRIYLLLPCKDCVQICFTQGLCKAAYLGLKHSSSVLNRNLNYKFSLVPRLDFGHYFHVVEYNKVGDEQCWD